ncbi:uncharacterized protein METZ01_LOCUS210827, partial [marine metagenome]
VLIAVKKQIIKKAITLIIEWVTLKAQDNYVLDVIIMKNS